MKKDTLLAKLLMAKEEATKTPADWFEYQRQNRERCRKAHRSTH
jgi:hypothetical protein